jgi:hypothetical protein
MKGNTASGPPISLFVVLMVAGFVTSGLYLGVMRADGVSTGAALRAVGFGALGIVMLWGILSRR